MDSETELPVQNVQDIIMTSTTLMPSKFNGLSSENKEQFLNDIVNYCAFKKLGDAGRVGLFPLLLKEGARFWFDSLD